MSVGRRGGGGGRGRREKILIYSHFPMRNSAMNESILFCPGGLIGGEEGWKTVRKEFVIFSNGC